MKQFKKDIQEGRIKEGLSSFLHRKHLPIVGYVLLAFFVGLTFYLQDRDRQQSRTDLRSAFALQCERVNELSNNQAADIYQSWVDLEKNAKLLGIDLTPELRAEVLKNDNAHLVKLRYYDCTISPFEEQVFRSYQPILVDKPIPKVPPTLPRHAS